jgi:SAM-dependent methyltransferase
VAAGDQAASPDSASLERMRGRWREFARRDPMFYIATNRRSWAEAEFFSQGRELVRDVLAWAGNDIGRERMIEIGSGLGRMLVHFAPHFERVDGVDIAPEMIEGARQADLPPNIHLTATSGSDLAPFEDADFDFAFSFQVFQHIPDEAVIASYLREIQRVLKPGGRAVVQFDSRPHRPVERLVLALPDAALPRTRRRYIRRYRLPAHRSAALATRAGLRVADERGRATEEHLLLLEKPFTTAL